MKITLFALNSSFTHTNLAIRYLASSLDDAGFCCNLCEYNLNDDHGRVLYDLVNQSSDIYAFSVYIWNRNEMLKCARELKMLKPDSFIIFGGPEVSFESDVFFSEHPYIDTVITGEGEGIITEICSDINRYKGKIIAGNCSERFLNEGILYDMYPADGNILYYESTRGCPHRCSYCLSAISGGVRAKSTEKTLEDLRAFEKLENKPKIIKFIDRTFNYDINRAKKIWKALLKDEFTLNYHFEIAADKLDEEAFDILSKMPAGKIQFEAGIQSTHDKTLEAVKRKTDPHKVIENLKRLRKQCNIHIHADLIAGLPFESLEDFKISFNEAIGCCHKLQLGFLKLLKGSMLRYEADEFGYIYENDPPYKVLSNKYISYNELHELELIAATLERFYSKDNFRNTVDYIIKVCPSPFEFFKELTNRLPLSTDKLSQHQCRLLLIDMVKDDCTAMTMLALDTLIWENKKPPEALTKYYSHVSKGIITSLSENFKGYENYNFNIYTLFDDDNNYYAIDSTKHKMIKIKRCT